MATLLGDARIRLRADTSGFESEARSGVGSALGKIGKTGAIALGAATAAGGALLTSVVKTGIAYNDLEQRSRAAFTTILGSADAATNMMAQIREFGRSSPFPRQAFISATQQLLGFGFAADDIIPTLKVINDTTAAVGGNADTIGTLTDVFAKIKSNGKITGEELNRLGAVGINAADMLGKSLGKSGDMIRKDISDGLVDADTAIGILTESMGSKFAGASENVKNTWSGAMDRVKGATRDLGSALVEPFISTGGGGIALDWANGLADRLRVAANATPAILELLTTGNYNGQLLEILGWDEDSKAVDNLLRIREAAVGLYDLLVRGDYTGLLRNAFGWEEDSQAVDVLLTLRDAAIDAAGAIRGVFTGDMEGARAKVGEVGDSLSHLMPMLKDLGPALSSAASTSAGLFSDALTVLGGVLRIVADNMDFIVKAAPYIAAAYAAAAGSARIFALAAAFVQTRLLLGTAVTIANIAAMRAHTGALIANAAAVNRVTIAEQMRMIAEIRANQWTARKVAVLVATKVALVATTVATVAATAAQWAFNAALAVPLIPLLAIVAGIALLVGAIVLLWKHNETFRRIVTGAWEGIKSAVGAVIDWFRTGGVVDALQWVWDKVSAGAQWLWDVLKSGASGLRDAFWAAVHGVQDAWGWLVDKAQALWAAVSPVFVAIGDAFAEVGRVVRHIWDGWIFPVLDLLGAVFTLLWKTTITLAVAGIMLVWRKLGDAFSWVYDTLIKPVFGWFADAASWLWNEAIKPAAQGIADAWSAMTRAIGDGLRWVWDSVISPVVDWIVDKWDYLVAAVQLAWTLIWKPVLTAIGDAFQWIWNKIISPVIGWIVDKWNWLADKFQTGWVILRAVFDALRDVIENKVKTAFEKGVDAIGRAWDMLKDKAKEPVRFVVDTIINKGIVDNFNKLADVFGTKPMERVKLPAGFARGGILPGTSSWRGGDTHLRPMREGEGVYVSEAMRDPYERARLHAVNATAMRGGNLAQFREGYAEGGIVGLGKWFQGLGANVAEHPAFGGVAPVHKGRAHYEGRAIDVNKGAGTSAAEQAFFDKYVAQVRAMGFKVLWRVAGHFNHLHAEAPKGFLGKISDAVGGAWDSATSFLTPFTDLVGGLKDKALSTPFGGLLAGGASKMIDSVKSFVSEKASALNPFSGADVTANLGEYDGATGKLSPSAARSTGLSMLPQGWSWPALLNLWNKESGWSWSADNPSSSAYGIPQALPGKKMASAGGDWATNAITQIKWGLGYIADRYGNSQAAWAHSQAKNWYAGGTLAARRGLAVVGEKGPELVDFKGGESVRTARATADLLSGGGPLVGSLTLVSANDTRRDIDTVMHTLRVLQRGGRP